MTLRNTIKTVVDNANLGAAFYADDAPNNPAYPHIVARMDPNASNLLNGDGRIMARNRNISLSVYDRQGQETEALTLAVIAVLDGYRAPGMKLRALGWRRVVDQAFGVVQWDIDLNAVFWG